MFFNWLTLDDINRNRLKFIVEQNENKEIKPMVLALEQWNSLQNYGMSKQFLWLFFLNIYRLFDSTFKN